MTSEPVDRLDGPAKPYPKLAQTARGERRTSRKVAGRARWAEIAAKKQGDCRCCGHRPPNELHHLIARSQGGSDTESNIVPLCRLCHGRVENRDEPECSQLALSLTDFEYAYVITTYGEAFFERRLGVKYERP